MFRTFGVLSLALACLACPTTKPPPPPPPVERCAVDLEASGLFSSVGAGARAKVIEAESELVGGTFAQGGVGDYLLENDRIRVVVQKPSRVLGPAPYGGAIIDADLKRPAGQPGRDAMGKLGLLYHFGRTVKTNTVEVLNDGSAGGYAVVAATGVDAVNDYMNVPNVIRQYIGPGFSLVVNPNDPLPLLITTYFVLSPGESRVRMLTAFCNTSKGNVITAVGDIFEQGGSTDFLNPSGCLNGFGSTGCLIDGSPWFGYQGDGLAYAVRSYKTSDGKTVEPSNALLTVSGVSAILAGGENQAGMTTWLDNNASRRPGVFGILPESQKRYVRDFIVGRDFAEITSGFLATDGTAHARVNLTVTDVGGAPAAARVAVLDSTGVQRSLVVTDTDGKGKIDLTPGAWSFAAAVPGAAIPASKTITVPSTGSIDLALALGARRRLTVRVKDPSGQAIPAKVVLTCSGSCPYSAQSYRPFFDIDDVPSNVAAVAFVPPSGEWTLQVPPGTYRAFVTRGPEYSAWPDTFPSTGAPVDLTTQDASIDAVLAHVIDTTGWLSADLHLHAMASADSSISNDERVLSYLAEGVDVLVSTDHDYITDYAPVVSRLGASALVSTLMGDEITPFDFGHQQAYPLSRGTSPNGSAPDWAGGDGPTLRLDELYAAVRSAYPNVVLQMNHPRSGDGSLTQLKVDTATGASHELPETFRMSPHPAATANDTHLLAKDFDAIEVQNGSTPQYAVFNDWMTFLSGGWVKSATSVSDSHTARLNAPGYGRTFVKAGVDDAASFSQDGFVNALKAHRAVGGNGPFITLKAQRLDGASMPIGAPVEIGGTLSVPSGSTVDLIVEVQAPEWMTFDVVEVYTHAAGREATMGDANESWPTSRIMKQKAWAPGTLPLEAVPFGGGFTGHRIHVTEHFAVTPTRDTWYVAMVRCTSAACADFFPMVWHDVGCDNGLCKAGVNTRAFGYTNALLVDADGSGAYDQFPLQPSLPLTRGPAPSPPERRAPTAEEVRRGLARALDRRHGG